MRGQVYLLRDIERGLSSVYEDAADAIAFIGHDLGKDLAKGHRATLSRLLRQGVGITLDGYTVKQHKLITKGRLY